MQEVKTQENDQSNRWANQEKLHEKAISEVKECKNISKSKKKGILNVAFRQEEILKRFMYSKRFRNDKRTCCKQVNCLF